MHGVHAYVCMCVSVRALICCFKLNYLAWFMKSKYTKYHHFFSSEELKKSPLEVYQYFSFCFFSKWSILFQRETAFLWTSEMKT